MIGTIYKSVSLDTKALDNDTRTVEGYASVFNNVDSDQDRLVKGSFARTIKSWGPSGKNRIKLVSQHNINQPVAKITDLYEDEKGLKIKAVFGTHTAGEDHYKQVKEGILTEFSIGFVPVKEEKNEYGGNDFTEVKLYEVSLVTVAANDMALVTNVKGEVEIDRYVEKLLSELDSLGKVLKSEVEGDFAFECETRIHRIKSMLDKYTTHSEEIASTDSVVPEPTLDELMTGFHNPTN